MQATDNVVYDIEQRLQKSTGCIDVDTVMKKFTKLGSGCFSTVYTHPEYNDRVIKIVHNEVQDDFYKDYVAYIKTMQTPDSIFPVIYSSVYGSNRTHNRYEIHVVERLYEAPAHPVKTALNILQDEFFHVYDMNSNFESYINYVKARMKLSETEVQSLNSAYTMFHSLCFLEDDGYCCTTDIGSNNTMCRANGDIVLSDPIAFGYFDYVDL